jgi:outer membrane protein OmpA-like peptidoglycan-associated protein
MRRLALVRTAAQAAANARFLVICLILSFSSHVHAQSLEASGEASLDASSRGDGDGASDASDEAATSSSEDEAAREERERTRQLRAGSTYFGQVGGIYVHDAGSGAPKSFRLQLVSDFFVKKNFLKRTATGGDDKDRFVGSSLALGITPIEHLELSAAITTRTNRNDAYTQEALSAIGDTQFGIKSYGEPTEGLTLGGGASVAFLGDQDGSGIEFKATSVTLRGNLALDLRKLADDVPMQLRLNLAYTFDNSAKTVEDLEAARFKNLVDSGETTATSPEDDYNHYINRHERLAFGVNRVDRFTVGLGVEIPVEISESVAFHPMVEWQLDTPINRQGFDCPYVVTNTGEKFPTTDSCLSQEGIDTWPQHLTIGARLWPYAGLSLLAAVDVGLGGATNFVQELAPTTPYRILLGAGYTIDARPKPRQVEKVVVEKEVVVEVKQQLGRVRGTILEQEVGTVIPDAKITFSNKPETTPLWGGADGTFISYPFEPGEVSVDVEAEGYQPGTCSATIPPQGGDVDMGCMLVALPRVGSLNAQVLGTGATPLPGVSVILTGPAVRPVTTDAFGKLEEQGLPPGEYGARVEQDGYLISVTPFAVKAREATQLTIQLTPTPKKSLVKLQKNKIQIRDSIYFTTDTADIEARSAPLLTEIADVIMRNPDLLQVEIQGHTDDTGSPDHNNDLSHRRAEAVRAWLVRGGVAPDRLVAKGYGMSKPIVPNLSAQNRAKNRRVEFVVLQRAGE